MSRVEELEGQIESLTSSEFQQLRNWLADYDAQIWDQQFEADVAAGKLDAPADRALIDFLQGRSTEL